MLSPNVGQLREEEVRILEQTPSPGGPLLLVLRGSQPHGLPRSITNAHVAMLLQEIKQTVSMTRRA